MRIDAIDRLIQIGFAEGVITTHGLYETTVLSRKKKTNLPRRAAARAVRRLELAIEESPEQSEVPETVGVCLQNLRRRHGLRDVEVSGRLNIPAATYRMMEADGISPLNIHPRVWQRLMVLVGLTSGELEVLIRTTCTLRRMGPSLHSTLARYHPRQNGRVRFSVLEQAARELFLRSAPILPKETEKKVAALMARIIHHSS